MCCVDYLLWINVMLEWSYLGLGVSFLGKFGISFIVVMLVGKVW